MKLKSILPLMGLLFPVLVIFAASGGAEPQITGTVVDPQGAVIQKATVTLINQPSGEVRIALTNAKGEFSFSDLRPGAYRLSVSQSGFQTLVRQRLELGREQELHLDLTLQVAPAIEQVEVTEKTPADPVYRQLRQAGFSGQMATLEDLRLKRDAGIFHFQQGTIYFLSPVMGRVTGALFVGQGQFIMRPPTEIERDHLRLFLDDAEDQTRVREPFERLILYFTDNTYQELKANASLRKGSAPGSVIDQFKDHQRVLRRELRQSIELRILGDLYNPARAPQAGNGDAPYRGFFTAFIKGRHHKKLIFATDPLGVIPDLPSPEEVGLISFDRETGGIWSLFHYEDEYRNRTASSNENHLEVDITHYRIEAVIDRGEHLTASAQITLSPRLPGLRVVPFALYRKLRVSRVIDETGTALPFIQTDEEEGGALAVIYPRPLETEARTLTIEYRGSGAIRDSGGGNYILNPAARSTWYPNNWQTTFGDRATFDMTFRVPRNLEFVATARKVREWEEDNYAASQWISDFPLAVAGFNYGDFRALSEQDKGFHIEVFTNRQDPDEIKRLRFAVEDIERQGGTPLVTVGNLSTAGLAKRSMVEAMNAIRIYNLFFGLNPYNRIVMSQQPAAFFGQSWPMLVYMPYTAFLDATQRRSMGLGARFSDFTDVVGPHEIAHQWWGHLVSWKTYHDQWLSEGFAEFSASIYLQMAYHKDARKRYQRSLDFWKDERDVIVEKAPLGVQRASRRANDVGPIWMGSRLDNGRTGGAYSRLIYRKGAFVLHMLRILMTDYRAKPSHQDDRFIAMMQDFVRTYMHQSASTEDFKRMVEKHMTPQMDLDNNGRMDWFFNQWVYGTALPHYELEYGFGTAPDGKPLVRIKITQSNVSPDFKMLIPIYLDYGKRRIARLGDAKITGNSTQTADVPVAKKPKAVRLCANYDVLCTIREARMK